MLDRAIGIFGLALALLFGLYSLAPANWPKMPVWASLAGIGVGIFLTGVAAGLLVGDWQGDRPAAKPDMHLAISGANVFVPDAKPNWTGIAIDAQVWNTGTPSIATGWAMKIIPNGGAAVTAQLTAMPNVLSATGPFNSANLLATNSLERKATHDKVGETPVNGVLLFYTTLSKDVAQAPDTVWEVSVRDIYERETKVSHLVGDWLQR